ncbi:MAG TPA: 8-amino-7-oxononanoate synthase [Candidatus Barnesiella excrementipullorum]|uniref:8-amino-7-oxononanoate synthase n=1 Tax=Candidatus Barnesiella excrementipullorum TaxID=2838479 RepID=A0A9D1VQU4_9BACT|nr:8-amino-7-oxononanoate synthase [Candidatus Barnesiella excrementipullorum]
MKAYNEALEELRRNGRLRQLTETECGERLIVRDGAPMLNLSSNDYLGIAQDHSLWKSFLEETPPERLLPSAVSSRLLTGNHPAYTRLERLLTRLYDRPAALVFNSGYHANSGILPAIADNRTLILADKLIHASLIDGLHLGHAPYIRYRHNDYQHLEALLREKAPLFDTVIVATESIFSMDGDICNLPRLIALKREFRNVMLYIDEAHAIGVRGQHGLGLCEEYNCIADVDMLVVTFGKAIASVGAALICDREIKEWLVNTMRPFIFTTALPPINVEWTHYILSHLDGMADKRRHLATIAQRVNDTITQERGDTGSRSHIIPYIIGDAAEAQAEAIRMQRQGFYLLPVRPPTVPAGTSRLRISLHAACNDEEIDRLIVALTQKKEV